jgi:chromate reductase
MSSMTLRIGYVVGSLSATSVNRTVARALVTMAPDDAELREIPIGDLPLFNRDMESDYPPEARALKAAIADVDALLFLTPEHNRSIPAALKNAIDFASRPYGTSPLVGKPAAIAGASPSAVGTAVAQSHLRSILPVLQVVVMGQPELYLSITPHSFDEQGRPEPALGGLLAGFLTSFTVFARQVGRPPTG